MYFWLKLRVVMSDFRSDESFPVRTGSCRKKNTILISIWKVKYSHFPNLTQISRENAKFSFSLYNPRAVLLTPGQTILNSPQDLLSWAFQKLQRKQFAKGLRYAAKLASSSLSQIKEAKRLKIKLKSLEAYSSY